MFRRQGDVRGRVGFGTLRRKFLSPVMHVLANFRCRTHPKATVLPKTPTVIGPLVDMCTQAERRTSLETLTVSLGVLSKGWETARCRFPPELSAREGATTRKVGPNCLLSTLAERPVMSSAAELLGI